MDFNTLLFPCFFAAVTLLYYLLPRVAQPVLLLAASYLFYCWKPENRALVLLLILATAVTWVCGQAVSQAKQRWVKGVFVGVACAFCLGFLLLFKYFNFFAGLLTGGAAKPLDLAAPLGLSYFVFQSLGYVIDCSRGKYPPEKNPLYYALFVSFFPCIFTGPIERADHLLPQLRQGCRFDYDNVAGGAFRMLWGYAKKMVLADRLALFVAAYYSGGMAATGPAQAMAAVLFTLQLYFDFSGCCDMAIGGARMLGIRLLENFDNPFLSTSFAELWRRWHKSLNSWFRDYVYITLGGSRKGLARWALATLAVFVLSGLWHGAAAGYFWWGALCGVLILIERLPAMLRRTHPSAAPVSARHTGAHCRGKTDLPAPAAAALSFLGRWARRVLTFAELSFTFIFFSASLYKAPADLHPYRTLLSGWTAKNFELLQAALVTNDLLGGPLQWVLIGGTTLVLALESRGNVGEWVRRRWFFIRWPLYLLLAAAILFFGVFGQSAFIYQQY